LRHHRTPQCAGLLRHGACARRHQRGAGPARRRPDPAGAAVARCGLQLPALARHARPGTHGPLRAADGPDPRPAGPGRHRARRACFLPPLRQRVPRPAPAGRVIPAATGRSVRMKPIQARVLLTGATGGIGQATARALLRAGASLLLVGRSEGALDELSRQLTAAGASASRVRWIAVDLTQARDVQRLVIEAARLDCNVVIHGAGLPAFGALQTLPAADISSVLQTNLEVPVLLTQALLPRLLTLPQAQIVCVGSALGRMGLPGFSVYSASKFGLLGFAEALRRELADTTVRVQYLGPRTTRTRFNAPAVTAYNRATG